MVEALQQFGEGLSEAWLQSGRGLVEALQRLGGGLEEVWQRPGGGLVETLQRLGRGQTEVHQSLLAAEGVLVAAPKEYISLVVPG